MSFLGGLVLGSMLSNDRSYHGHYSIRYRSWEEIWPQMLTVAIIFFVISYIVAILSNRSLLKAYIDDYGSFSVTPSFYMSQYYTTNEGKTCKIKFRMETLQEKPKFFLSPLWIAKFTLRTQINAGLVKLQNELIELKS